MNGIIWPDTIEDDWIGSVGNLEAMVDGHTHLRQRAQNVLEVGYEQTTNPDESRRELRSRVLAPPDVVERLSEPA